MADDPISNKADELFFRDRLMQWYEPEARPMPWKGETDPYLIWLSEVILQQTRVEQGLPYFERFRRRYPDVRALAAAPEDEIMKMWEGLGYYRRARHMHRAAKMLVAERQGAFPDTYEEIMALPGVGPYTAAAVASFAYDLPHAVVDGNVYRVLARFFGIREEVGSAAGKRVFQDLAGRVLDPERPGHFNQAIMDFGATRCRPRAPRCADCPLAARCQAYGEGDPQAYPVKRAARPKRYRFFHYLVMRYGEQRYVRKRVEDDIWHNLYEFPLVERPKAHTRVASLVQDDAWRSWLGHEAFTYEGASNPVSQTLSHQIVRATFHHLTLEEPPRPRGRELLAVPAGELRQYAFPRLYDWYFRENSLSLNI